MFLCFGFQTSHFNTNAQSEWKVNLHVLPLKILSQNNNFTHLHFDNNNHPLSDQHLCCDRDAGHMCHSLVSHSAPQHACATGGDWARAGTFQLQTHPTGSIPRMDTARRQQDVLLRAQGNECGLKRGYRTLEKVGSYRQCKTTRKFPLSPDCKQHLGWDLHTCAIVTLRSCLSPFGAVKQLERR